LLEVEYLQGARLCLEGDDLACPVHNGTVCLDRATDDIIAILEVDDEDFWRRGFVLLISDADERV